MREALGNLRLWARKGLLLTFAATLFLSQLVFMSVGRVSATIINPQLVSVDHNGQKMSGEAAQISDDGRYVAFRLYEGGGNNLGIYIRDRSLNKTDLVTSYASGEAISSEYLDNYFFMAGNGSKVLLRGVNLQIDSRTLQNQFYLYAKNTQTGSLEVASIDPSGAAASVGTARSADNGGGAEAWLSDDGNAVAWNKDNIGYFRNISTQSTIQLDGRIRAMSGNGQFVFLNRDDGFLYKKDIMNGTEVWLGSYANPLDTQSVSDDGRYILYKRVIYTHSVITRFDTLTLTPQDVGPQPDYEMNGTVKMSGDGNIVAFIGHRCLEPYVDCPASHYQAFIHNISENSEYLISKNSYGNQADQAIFAFEVYGSVLTYNGGEVVYSSDSSNLGLFGSGSFRIFAQSTANSSPDVVDVDAPIVTEEATVSVPTKDRVDTATVTVSAVDAVSGVAYGEFFLNDNWHISSGPTVIANGTRLPYGYATSMTLSNGQLIGTIGNDVPPGDYTVYVRVQDYAGNWTTDQATHIQVTGDATAPHVGQLGWSINPKSISETSSLTVSVTDDLSGVARGEYFIGDTDPGQGNGATMNWDGTNLTTTFGTDFQTGVYKISVRAQDNAGNWSEPVSDYLVVYDPSGPRMTGRRTITPSLNNGDILPGLISSTQTDVATFAFSVKYDASGQINANSDLQFKYQTGTKCKNAAQAQNCHSFDLDANSIAWLTTQGTNNSTGVFQGTATLVVDGVTSQVTFRVTGVDGSRLGSTSPDQFEVRIFAQGADPNTATPIYVINPTSLTQGDIKII